MKYQQYLERPERDKFQQEQNLARMIEHFKEKILNEIHVNFEDRNYEVKTRTQTQLNGGGPIEETEFYKVLGNFKMDWSGEEEDEIRVVLKAVRVKLQEYIPAEWDWTTFDFSFKVVKATRTWMFWRKKQEPHIHVFYNMEKITNAD